MNTLTTLPNGGNLYTDGLTTHCCFPREPIFDVLCAFGKASAQSPWSGTSDIGFPIFWRTEPKRLAFGETTETIFAECIQAGSCKLAGKYATKEPGIGLRKTRLPYTPIRLGCVASIQYVGRGADCLTRRYTTNLLKQGRWLVWSAMSEIQRSAV